MAERKYTKAGLKKAVERYFQSISRTVTVTEQYDTGEKDDKGHVIFGTRPVYNDLGEQIRVTEYLVPPTVDDLSIFLGIHRSTWDNYCDPEKNPDFFDTTTCARGRIRAYRVRELQVREGKNTRGIEFLLRNEDNMEEKLRVELGGQVSGRPAPLTLEEREALLREIAAEFGEKETGGQ